MVSPQKRKGRRGRGARRHAASTAASTAQAPLCLPRTWGADFKPLRSELLEQMNESLRQSGEKRARCDIECPEVKCSKKFRCHSALEYHRIHAHVQSEIDSVNRRAAAAAAATNRKQTRGTQTPPCAELQQNGKPSMTAAATSTSCDANHNQATGLGQGHSRSQADASQQFSGLSISELSSSSRDASSSRDRAPADAVTSHPSQSPNHSFTNHQQYASGTERQSGLFSPQKGSPMAGSARSSMLVSKSESVKKSSAPVAVLRPLVPQQVAKVSADKTLASLTTPTHTLSISCSQPQYAMPQVTAMTSSSTSFSVPKQTQALGSGASSRSGATGHRGHHSAAAVYDSSTSSRHQSLPAQVERPTAHPNVAKPLGPPPTSLANRPPPAPHSSSSSGGGGGAKMQTPPAAAAALSGPGLVRSNSTKSLRRSSSRSNSLISPNYSDISDVSDADMDTSQQESAAPVAPASISGSGANRPVTTTTTGDAQSRGAEMTEDRLYCNEELHSPGGGQSRDREVAQRPPSSGAASQRGAVPTSDASRAVSQSGSGGGGSGRQSVPLHAVPPPQHIMYPYFPFMPSSPLGNHGPPISGAPPLYASPPAYFMPYPQGFPVMQGGMPPQLHGGPAYVAVSGAGPPPSGPPPQQPQGHPASSPAQVPRSRPN